MSGPVARAGFCSRTTRSATPSTCRCAGAGVRHEERCARYDADAGFPPALRRARLTFNAYRADRALVARERTEAGGEVEAAVDSLLGEPAVECVHVRSTSVGCFLCRLDAVPAAA